MLSLFSAAIYFNALGVVQARTAATDSAIIEHKPVVQERVLVVEQGKNGNGALEKTNNLEEKIGGVLRGTPMEAMIEDISTREKKVAALMVGIAMKESKFGKYAPGKSGRDCYNYWGYRGKENRTTSGYSCFESPKQAVDVISRRIERLINEGADSPAEMTVWKCGYSCKGHDPASVNKWISDVSIHYNGIMAEGQIVKK